MPQEETVAEQCVQIAEGVRAAADRDGIPDDSHDGGAGVRLSHCLGN